MASSRGRGSNVAYVPGIVSGQAYGRGGGGVVYTAPYRQLPAGTGGWKGLIDLSTPAGWRTLYVAGAVAYLGIFHLTLPGGVATVGRVGGGMPHGHGMATALYLASWLIVIDAARDVIAFSFPNVTAAQALHNTV